MIIKLSDGSTREVDQVVSACGYRFTMDGLDFLSPEIRDGIRLNSSGTPLIDGAFRSVSNPRITFVGFPAEKTFGPVVRAVDGARFTCARSARSF